VQLEQELAIAKNKLQDAQDKNMQLKEDLLSARHDLASKTHLMRQLEDEAKVHQSSHLQTFSPRGSPKSGSTDAQKHLTDQVNDAKNRRDGYQGSEDSDRVWQSKYDRLKAQYQSLDESHKKLEDALRQSNQEVQLAKAKYRHEIEAERQTSARVASEEKRHLAKARVQVKQQQERLREEARDLARAKAEADSVIQQANLLSNARTSAADARLQVHGTCLFHGTHPNPCHFDNVRACRVGFEKRA